MDATKVFVAATLRSGPVARSIANFAAWASGESGVFVKAMVTLVRAELTACTISGLFPD
jgi:hypothetical protein